MNSAELKKLLAKHGCTFEAKRGKGGHITVKLGDRKTVMPVHGSRKELGRGLVAKIKKDLGIE
ncbi:type II toxin-antitoxin system HicA family toxin [Salipiger thiooxidans]|uniref:type II toxin-antitoxin system HicA family toxin n=1 Tax=Salipiger thiooxidans TaxID=282683 RepID=UPI001A8DEB88|nr:type II toxin-antitoxin system HicA family toxin [Salipiger thiooxidans]MBN8189544.1 type II toxin-antitoxin system HicA family toxin [Salipiger thiooxidans]